MIYLDLFSDFYGTSLSFSLITGDILTSTVTPNKLTYDVLLILAIVHLPYVSEGPVLMCLLRPCGVPLSPRPYLHNLYLLHITVLLQGSRSLESTSPSVLLQ